MITDQFMAALLNQGPIAAARYLRQIDADNPSMTLVRYLCGQSYTYTNCIEYNISLEQFCRAFVIVASGGNPAATTPAATPDRIGGLFRISESLWESDILPAAIAVDPMLDPAPPCSWENATSKEILGTSYGIAYAYWCLTEQDTVSGIEAIRGRAGWLANVNLSRWFITAGLMLRQEEKSRLIRLAELVIMTLQAVVVADSSTPYIVEPGPQGI